MLNGHLGIAFQVHQDCYGASRVGLWMTNLDASNGSRLHAAIDLEGFELSSGLSEFQTRQTHGQSLLLTFIQE